MKTQDQINMSMVRKSIADTARQCAARKDHSSKMLLLGMLSVAVKMEVIQWNHYTAIAAKFVNN
jgi:hypothetical protein